MYDDAAGRSIRPMGHWYDEPPYESDPDDFLMSGINSGPAAIIQVCILLFHNSLNTRKLLNSFAIKLHISDKFEQSQK